MIDKFWFLSGVILIILAGFIACFFSLGAIGILPVVLAGLGGSAFTIALIGGDDSE